MDQHRTESDVRPLRLSQRLRLLAVLTTLLTVAICAALLWSAFGAFLESGSAASEPPDTGVEPLVVAVGRTPGGPGEWVSYAAAFANLQDDLGRPVQLRYVQEGSEITSLVSEGRADVALVTVGTYLELEATDAATLVVAPVVAGEQRDAAVVVVAGRGEQRALEDVRGGTVVLTEGSLSGDKFAEWLARERGSTIDAFFGGVLLAESQDLALTEVDSGRAVAACVRRSALASWPVGAFRIVATSPEFGMPPVVARTGLDPALLAQVRESLLGFDASTLPSSSLLEGFRTVATDDYAFARILDELPAYGGAQ